MSRSRKTKSRSSERPATRGRRARGGQAPVEQTRIMIAQAAARVMYEQGIRDYGFARSKAAASMGVTDRALLPDNEQIHQALLAHQRLFDGAESPARLRRLRETAIEAMRFFSAFEPRLVGDALGGGTTPHSVVTLHLFTDVAEQVATHLIDSRIPYRQRERTLRFDDERSGRFPLYAFDADGVTVEAIVFAFDGLRRAPRCALKGGPQRRASLAQVKALLLEAPQS